MTFNVTPDTPPPNLILRTPNGLRHGAYWTRTLDPSIIIREPKKSVLVGGTGKTSDGWGLVSEAEEYLGFVPDGAEIETAEYVIMYEMHIGPWYQLCAYQAGAAIIDRHKDEAWKALIIRNNP